MPLTIEWLYAFKTIYWESSGTFWNCLFKPFSITLVQVVTAVNVRLNSSGMINLYRDVCLPFGWLIVWVCVCVCFLDWTILQWFLSFVCWIAPTTTLNQIKQIKQMINNRINVVPLQQCHSYMKSMLPRADGRPTHSSFDLFGVCSCKTLTYVYVNTNLNQTVWATVATKSFDISVSRYTAFYITLHMLQRSRLSKFLDALKCNLWRFQNSKMWTDWITRVNQMLS